MVVNLRSGTTRPDEKGLIGQFGPSDTLPRGKRISIRNSHDKRLGPNSTGVATGRVRSTNHECDVELIGAQLGDGLPRRALGDIDLHTGIGLTESADQLGEETMGDEAVDAYAQAAALSQGHHTGRLYSIVEVIDTRRYPFNKKASGFSEPDAACVTFEQEDAKILLQRLDAGADARLANAEGIGGAAEAQMLGYGKRLDQRDHWYA